MCTRIDNIKESTHNDIKLAIILERPMSTCMTLTWLLSWQCIFTCVEHAESNLLDPVLTQWDFWSKHCKKYSTWNFQQVVLLYQHVKYTTIGWFPKVKTKLLGALVQRFSRIIRPIWTLNQGWKKSKNHVKEHTLNHKFFAGSFMKKLGSLKFSKTKNWSLFYF